jgi:Domain of unknown function (DUF2357)/PD-(D/E)XK nuclease superfamily
VNDVAVLETPHLEVCGGPGTIDPSTDPPLLFTEETYVVRPRAGGGVRPGLAGALTVLPGAHEARLRFGNFVGLAELDGRLVRIDSYRITVPDADRMLDELVAALRSLPSRALPPTGATFDRPLVHADDIDLLAYLVVRDAVRGHGPHDLTAAMARILARPNERLANERADRPIWAADRIDGGTLIEIAARAIDRIRVPADSPLACSPIALRLGGVLPTRNRVGRSIPTTDTLENRFIATVLDRCLAIVRTVAAHAARGSSAAMEPLRAEAAQLAATLERWRLHRALEDLRPLRRLPTTSTVLRGRPGYRDVLRLYADLLGRTRIVPPSAAMRIVGLRDIAALYEWWCFFEVVRAVSDILGPPVRVDPASHTWQGAELGQGITAHFSGSVRVEFNRSFSSRQTGKHRSYSVPLRPDILVETPHERHIFDAKFAFEPLSSSLDHDDDNIEDESPAGRARRWHIHKMHTYRDALDRVASVRVLYPGSTDEWYPVVSPGARDGVGALPLRVGNAADSGALRSLLKELIPREGA